MTVMLNAQEHTSDKFNLEFFFHVYLCVVKIKQKQENMLNYKKYFFCFINKKINFAKENKNKNKI